MTNKKRVEGPVEDIDTFDLNIDLENKDGRRVTVKIAVAYPKNYGMSAVAALRKIGTEGIESLLYVLKDDDPSVQEFLSRVGDQDD